MQCKQCKKTIAGDAYKMVADWVFCTACFQQLLDKLAKRPADAPPDTTPDTPGGQIRSPPHVVNRCRICHGAVSRDKQVKLGIWTFCPDCYADLARTRSPPPAQEQADDREKEARQRAAAEKAAEQERIYLESRKIVHCRACGRPIHAGGSKPVEGEPYCPDCFYGLGLDENHA